VPLGTGYWLNLRSGQNFEVYDHESDVLNNPRRYGLDTSEIARATRESEQRYRERVLLTAMQHGWARVRQHHGGAVIEFWKFTRRGADVMYDCLIDTVGLGPLSTVVLSEALTRRSLTTSLEKFFDALDTRGFTGFYAPRKSPQGGLRLYLAGRAVGMGLI